MTIRGHRPGRKATVWCERRTLKAKGFGLGGPDAVWVVLRRENCKSMLLKIENQSSIAAILLQVEYSIKRY